MTMKEANLRKWHRNLGIAMALFIILQAGSGFLISLGQLSVPHSHADQATHASGHGSGEGRSIRSGGPAFLHHGGGAAGTIYRLALGVGMTAMAVSGSMIFFRIRARTRKK
jgi:hypothetical protein